MLVFGIVLRPLLLVTGILIGAVMISVVGWLLRLLMPLMIASLDVNSPPGFMSFLAVTLIMVVLCVTVALKCFSLSHELADEILEWLGGRQLSLGDDMHAGKAQGLVAAAGGAQVLTSVLGQARAAKEKRDEAASKRSDQSSHI